MRVCFLIRQLNTGGAQRQLVTLLQGMDKSVSEVRVLTFYSGGQFFDQVAAIPGVRCVSLEKKGRWDLCAFMIRLVRELRAARPNVLYAYLGTSNILSVLVKPFLPGTRLVWSVRTSDFDPGRDGRLSTLMYRIECFLSRRADLVIANSNAGRDCAVAHGFPARKTVVIYNGIDTDVFAPNEAARLSVRKEWNVGKDDLLVGFVGRIDPLKDIPNFLHAAVFFAGTHTHARFVCVGTGVEDYVQEMMAFGESLGLADRIIWAGARDDMPAVYCSLDVLVSSSHTEGFSNVVAEAMACGVRCAVTDVGDSRHIVGDIGAVVPVRDPQRLAEGISRVLENTELNTEDECRLRVVNLFSKDRMIVETEKQLCCLLSTP